MSGTSWPSRKGVASQKVANPRNLGWGPKGLRPFLPLFTGVRGSRILRTSGTNLNQLCKLPFRFIAEVTLWRTKCKTQRLEVSA
jgi:hypothetical protein